MTDQTATLEVEPAPDATAEEVATARSAEAELFTREELRQFDAEDVEAGKNLCKMLSLFFFYTVIVMGLSAWFTYVWISGG